MTNNLTDSEVNAALAVEVMGWKLVEGHYHKWGDTSMCDEYPRDYWVDTSKPVKMCDECESRLRKGQKLGPHDFGPESGICVSDFHPTSSLDHCAMCKERLSDAEKDRLETLISDYWEKNIEPTEWANRNLFSWVFFKLPPATLARLILAAKRGES